ncbi:MAG: ABC transporter ATP-binding protein/permease [Lachnospiraceae bacterium]|jgi:ATP-binding cassette subfamily B protein|nr:ABC transporter ATP-binding protein/permease [Lachnospiraceae bacterium]
MKRYWKYIKPYLPYFIIGPIMMIIEVLGEVLLPKMMANIANNGVAAGDIPYIIQTGAQMIGLALCMLLGGVGGAYFGSKASVNFAADLRADVFAKVQQFSFSNIDHFSTGSLVTRLTNDVTQMQNLVMMSLRIMLRAPGMLIGAIIMAFLMNAQLATVLLIVMPILIVVIILVMRAAFPRFQRMQQKLDHLNSTVQEALTNVRVIKSFVREDFEKDRFGQANEDLKDNALKAFRVVIMNMPLMMLAMNGTTLAIVWFGGNQILDNTMAIGDLSAFITYIVQVLMSLMMVAFVLLQVSRALASSKRIREVLDTIVDIDDTNATQKDQIVTKGEIEFRDVSFRYYKDTQEWVLDHISLRIEPGSTVGIIGSTGCGKTSLVQMIPRLYDVDQGEVLVDGVNVKDYSLNHLRDRVGMVLQKNVLFSGTIQENLEWGKEDATLEEIREEARKAQADPFIVSFTNGYDTELGQGGVNVSGGQKQRLCIARALLKNPKILILDDSTSAVDTATEAKIREELATSFAKTTTIVIAQRISSVIDADKIVVMDEGKIVGEGQHDQLLKTCETYQEIYYSQMDKEEEVSA